MPELTLDRGIGRYGCTRAGVWERSLPRSIPSCTAGWLSSRFNPATRENPSSRERFVAEAEITGNLEHPGIVPVYGLGAGPDGRPYYAMRFVKGETLVDGHSPISLRARRRFHGTRSFDGCCGGSWTCATRSPMHTVEGFCTAT